MQPAAASISTKVLWRVGCFIGVCFHKKSGSFRLPDLVRGGGTFCPILAAADCKPVDAILKMKIIIGAM